jgi:hypothetical protein
MIQTHVDVEAALESVSSPAVDVVPGAPAAAQVLVELEQEGLTSTDQSAASMKQAWTALSAVAGAALHKDLERVAYIESQETDTQVWIHRNQQLKRVCVPECMLWGCHNVLSRDTGCDQGTDCRQHSSCLLSCAGGSLCLDHSQASHSYCWVPTHIPGSPMTSNHPDPIQLCDSFVCENSPPQLSQSERRLSWRATAFRQCSCVTIVPREASLRRTLAIAPSDISLLYSSCSRSLMQCTGLP